jgi:hypothetical protein
MSRSGKKCRDNLWSGQKRSDLRGRAGMIGAIVDDFGEE